MTSPVENPYVGPRAFTVADRNRFFGREREARELLSRVIAERLVLFYAQSGAGKTSLINACLIPQLKAQSVGYAVLPVGRVSGDLPKGVQDVANIFIFNLLLHLDQSNGDPSRFTAMSLKDFLVGLSSEDGEHYYHDANIALEADSEEYETSVYVLIIDQFEEIFSTHLEHWQERKGFFHQLEEAMTADPKLWVVLSLREDYVAALDPYAPLIANRMRARFYMQRMGYDTALEAVRRPAEKYGRPFASGVAEQLVDNLRPLRVRGEITGLGEFVEPVQLQVVCYQLWEKLKDREPGLITAEDVRQSGDVDTALADFYEQAMTRVIQADGVFEVELREWFDQKLITEARTRGTVYMGDNQTAGLPNAVVRLLAEQYLLRAELRAGGVWYELVHDRFVEPILQANEQWLKLQDRLVQDAVDWKSSGSDESKLYVGEMLQDAVVKRRQGHQEPVVTAFLTASQEKNQKLVEAAQQRERELVDAARQRELEATRRLAEERAHTAAKLQRWAWMLSGALAVALLLAIAASWFYRQAEVARDRADSLHWAYLASQQNDKSTFTVGMLLALEALPKSMATPDRPYVSEAGQQLYRAVINQREKFVLAGHQNNVNYVAFSPDGKYLATASSDKTVHLWDVASGKLITKLSGHQKSINHVAFSPDGQRLATASDDNTARLWDVEGGKLLSTLEHQGSVNYVAFSPDGQRLATASGDMIARLWDVTSGKQLTELQGHLGLIKQVAFSPNGKLLATASGDMTARLWDADSGNELGQPFEHGSTVDYVAFSPDGKYLATASGDKTVRLWNVDSGKPLGEFEHGGPVNHVAFSPDGKYLATASEDTIARLWDIASGKLLALLKEHKGSVNYVVFSPDGQRLATASKDKTVRLWDVESGKQLAVLSDHKEPINHIAFSPDGKHLATASSDKTARLWDVEGDKLFTQLIGHQDWATRVAFSTDNTRLATASRDNTARVWDADSGKLLFSLHGHEASINHIIFSRDGKRLATASEDMTARLWDADSGKPIGKPLEHQGWVSHLAFSPDSKRLATVSWDKTARLWQADNGVLIKDLPGHRDRVNYVAFSLDGKRLATASSDNTARLWNAENGELLAELGHRAWVGSVAFSPDGKRLATASGDNTARLWDTESGTLLATFDHQGAAVIHVDFSPDGRRLATASSDNTARLWDVESGKLRAELTGHQGPIRCIAFSHDGKILATASEDQTARLWQADSGALIATLSGYQGLVYQVVFSHDDKRLATGARDPITRVWPVFPNIQALIDYANSVKPRELSPKERRQFNLPGDVPDFAEWGEKLAKQGKIDEALSDYQDALRMDPNDISAFAWNTLCWYGSLWGQASKIMDACERAVILNPEYGMFRDSRGLARALTGDFKGAIEDLEVAIPWQEASGFKEPAKERQAWLTNLQAGRNLTITKEWLERERRK